MKSTDPKLKWVVYEHNLEGMSLGELIKSYGEDAYFVDYGDGYHIELCLCYKRMETPLEVEARINLEREMAKQKKKKSKEIEIDLEVSEKDKERRLLYETLKAEFEGVK